MFGRCCRIFPTSGRCPFSAFVCFFHVLVFHAHAPAMKVIHVATEKNYRLAFSTFNSGGQLRLKRLVLLL